MLLLYYLKEWSQNACPRCCFCCNFQFGHHTFAIYLSTSPLRSDGLIASFFPDRCKIPILSYHQSQMHVEKLYWNFSYFSMTLSIKVSLTWTSGIPKSFIQPITTKGFHWWVLFVFFFSARSNSYNIYPVHPCANKGACTSPFPNALYIYIYKLNAIRLKTKWVYNTTVSIYFGRTEVENAKPIILVKSLMYLMIW